MNDQSAGVFFTEDQEFIETTALRLSEDPRVRIFLPALARVWIDRTPAAAAQRDRFDAAFDEAVFSGLMHAAASDARRPRLYGLGRLGRASAAGRLPATKTIHMNPDYIYRFITVDKDSRFVIRGWLPATGPSAIEYSLINAQQVYEHHMSLHTLQTAADGSFTISVDADAAGDRANHFQVSATSVQLLFRDIMGDALHQTPISLWIEPSEAEPPVDIPYEGILLRAEKYVAQHLESTIRTTDRVLQNPTNVFPAPNVLANDLFSVSQAYSIGHFSLEQDEALLVHLADGGAAHASAVASDFWGSAGDVAHHGLSFGSRRGHRNGDGTFTIAVSAKDPGLANWVDTDGLTAGVLFFRWAGLPPHAATNSPIILRTSVVKLCDIDALAPVTAPRSSGDLRLSEGHDRLQGYQRLMG